MPTTLEQVTPAIKATAEAQQALNAALGEKVFERLEELTRLNIDVVKASLAESIATAKELLHANNPQEFFSASAAYVKREMQSTVFYSSEVTRIASATQAAFNEAATKSIAEASRHGAALVTELTKNGPVGTEQIADIFKSAWGRAGDGAATVEEDRSVDSTSTHHASRKKSNGQTARTTH